MFSSIVYKPGQTALIGGIYAEVDLYGNQVDRNVTCLQGKPFPPTQEGGDGYILIWLSSP